MTEIITLTQGGTIRKVIRKLKEFTFGAGGWAVASDLASLVFFALSVIAVTRWGTSITAYVLLAISVVLFFMGAFIAWNKKAEEVETLKGQLKDLIKKPDRNWRAEWMETADRFKHLQGGVRAEWHSGGYGIVPKEGEWYTSATSGSTTASMRAKEECESLCSYAGGLLIKSPTISGRLSETVRTQSDALDRWLFFLKDNVSMDAEHLGTTEGIEIISRTIEHLGEASYNACIMCATAES